MGVTAAGELPGAAAIAALAPSRASGADLRGDLQQQEGQGAGKGTGKGTGKGKGRGRNWEGLVGGLVDVI